MVSLPPTKNIWSLNDQEACAGKYLDRSLTYGPNAVKSVQVTKVQILSGMDQVIV